MTIKNSLIKKFYVAITTVKMVRFSSTHQAKLNKISLLIYCWQGLEERIILHSLLLLLALLQLWWLAEGLLINFTLQIPIYTWSTINKGTGKAKDLQKAKALFWNEISITHKHGFEAVNRTLKNIRGDNHLMGGLIVVFAGDFCQTLPVYIRGTMVDEIKACLKSSQLWKER